MTASTHAAHLAQLNVATLSHPFDDPRMAPFVEMLDPVNAAADGSPGFVWRLVEDGEADATGLRPAGEDVIVNLSVWETREALWDFAYRSGHLEAMRRRREWFQRHVEAHLVLWWVPVGHVPTVGEALERLADLRAHGASPARSPSPPPTPPPRPPSTFPPCGPRRPRRSPGRLSGARDSTRKPVAGGPRRPAAGRHFRARPSGGRSTRPPPAGPPPARGPNGPRAEVRDRPDLPGRTYRGSRPMTVGTRADRWIVNGSGIDYEAVFQALPGAVALLTPDLVYVDANEAFLVTSGRTREQLIGRYLFDVFPDNPGDPEATGMRNLRDSLERVAATGERDTMALQRYDVEHASRPGVWEERYWSPVNVPVLASDGSVALLLHRVEEVTELIRARGGTRTDTVRARELASDLYLRGRELQEVNARLRQAHAREREVALHLQEAMLPAPRPLDHHEAAVRYRPATAALNVCGDWYDLVDMPERTAVAVGDVVGHGLRAAGVMGQLRSALSAASRVVVGPAQALEVLGLYARAIEGAESTTVVSVFIDWNDRTLTYSSAGHPRPHSAIPTAPSVSSTRRPTPRSAPGPNTPAARRPGPPSPTAPSSPSTPTASSNAAARTSTSVSDGSPTRSPGTAPPTPTPSPTPCWPTSFRPSASPTTRPSSSSAWRAGTHPGRRRDAAPAGQCGSSTDTYGDSARRNSAASNIAPAEATPVVRVCPARMRSTASTASGAVTA